MEYNITNYCTLKNNQIHLNGKEVFKIAAEESFIDFIKGSYKYFEMDYPKFYKMDALCKLSLIGSSLLLDLYKDDLDRNTALILTNHSSCIDIDRRHQENINEGGIEGARPANFVYTLPNIALGEISIKYELRSENSFFIFDQFNPNFLINYSRSLVELKKAKNLLCGWVEVNKNSYNGLLFMIEQREGIELNEKNLLKLV